MSILLPWAVRALNDVINTWGATWHGGLDESSVSVKYEIDDGYDCACCGNDPDPRRVLLRARGSVTSARGARREVRVEVDLTELSQQGFEALVAGIVSSDQQQALPA